METERSLPHLQMPATCPYPEPDQSSPHPQIPLPEDPINIYICSLLYEGVVRKCEIL